MMRKKIVAGNWKMNCTLDEGMKLTSEIVNMVKDERTDDVQVVLNPPSLHIHGVKRLIGDVPGLFVGAQNCSSKDSGAYTGEISAKMIASFGATHVIIGHSERREYFRESNEELTDKVRQALSQQLVPIFCCGEPLETREKGTQENYVHEQLRQSVFGLSDADFSRLVIAYEPIWAIGTGKTATADQAQEMHAAIRKEIASRFGEPIANTIPILYGGSLKPDNAREIFSKPDVDGGLVGGASLKSRDFMDIILSF
ncbi:MAG TPA: triose-phosphate isomerase [Cyclobacteriaceae bacterium]|nr:triose-phosphate isomerase [Cyclobacteriaceae bacterium]